MTHQLTRLMIISLMSAAPAFAQSLAEPNPVNKLVDIVQFGAPRDAQYVVCDNDCPERSFKHLNEQKPLAPPKAIIPAPQSMPVPQLAPEKKEIKKEPPKPVKKKLRRKKANARMDCNPPQAASPDKKESSRPRG